MNDRLKQRGKVLREGLAVGVVRTAGGIRAWDQAENECSTAGTPTASAVSYNRNSGR